MTASRPLSPTRLDDAHRDAYLRRLGLEVPAVPDDPALRELHRRHLTTIPFENLDILLGRPIDLDPGRLVDKLTLRQRGGFCYELNGAFASLLATLGFDVALAEARVIGADGSLGIPFDHLCLVVRLDRPLLVDVGFGALFDEPLEMTPDIEQHDAAGRFLLSGGTDGSFDLAFDGKPQYRLDPEPRRLDAFESGVCHHSMSPDSHFTRAPVCSLRTDRGRVTIRGSRAIETVDGTKSESNVGTDGLGDRYRSWFGIELDPDELETVTGGRPA